MPVCVLPIASCQSEAFCLFQYISDNLSLDGIQFDESGFLNGSRIVHIMSLLRYWCFEVRDSHFLVPLPNYTTFHMQVSLDGLLHQTEAFIQLGGLSLRLNNDPRVHWVGREDSLTSWESHFISFLSKCRFPFLLQHFRTFQREKNISLSVLTFLCLFSAMEGDRSSSERPWNHRGYMGFVLTSPF